MVKIVWKSNKEQNQQNQDLNGNQKNISKDEVRTGKTDTRNEEHEITKITGTVK